LTTKAEKRHMSAVAELGCSVCRRMGYPGTPAELHHPRSGVGMGKRSGHNSVIPLCPEHHRGNTGIHGMGVKAFTKHYQVDEAELLHVTRRLVAHHDHLSDGWRTPTQVD